MQGQSPLNHPGGRIASSSSSTNTSFSGGISAKLLVLPSEANFGQSHVLAQGTDVTISICSDAATRYTMLEIVELAAVGQMQLLCRYAFHAITSVNSAKTRRGIAVEICEEATDDAYRGPQIPSTLIQISFADPMAREKVMSIMLRQLQLEKDRRRRRSAVETTAAPTQGSSTPRSHLSPHHQAVPLKFDALLSTVRKLQDKTRNVLTDLRAEDEALCSAGGTPSQGGLGYGGMNSQDDLKGWAFNQLKKRSELLDAEQELRRIQQRRALRKTTMEDLENVPSPARGATLKGAVIGPASPEPAPQSASARSDAAFESPFRRGVVCPHCKGEYDDAHIKTCVYRQVRCKGCGLLIRAAESRLHKESCEGASVASSGTGASNHWATLKGAVVGPASPQQPSRRANSVSSESSFSSVPSVGSPAPTSGGKRIKFVEPMSRGITNRQSSGAGGSPTKRRPSGPAIVQSQQLSGSSSRRPVQQEPDQPDDGRCPHCFKPAPPEHFKRCASRVFACKRCGQEVTMRDKARHDDVCKNQRPGTTR